MRSTLTLALLVSLAPLSAAQVALLELTASDGGPEDSFGWSVALHGDRAVVADTNVDRGRVLAFDVHTGQELLELTASDGEKSDFFGWSVSLHGDRAIVGAWADDDHGASSGSAYVYDVTTGQELFKLTASDASPGDFFGRSVAIHGERAVVGAIHEDEAGPSAGAAYVFDVTTGQELFKLTASDGVFDDYFGGSVAIDAERVLVGAVGDDDRGTNSGSVYLFDLATGQELLKLVASNGAQGDYFGESVALDGGRAVVGAGWNDQLEVDAGSAYVFDAVTGAELLQLRAADGAAADRFGASVAVHGDLVLVGAPEVDDLGVSAGAAYLFDATTGEQVAKILASDGKDGDVLGASVSLHQERAIVGAYVNDDFGLSAGSAHVFGLGSPVGVRYCSPAVVNSTGLPAEIHAAGSGAVVDGDLYLAAVQMPEKHFGYFLNGPTQGFIANPGGSQGNLCLGGTIGRHVDDVFSTGKTGTGSLLLDLSNVPFPGGGHTIVAGETWNWIAWFRDENPHKTSNFTDGVSILFQ